MISVEVLLRTYRLMLRARAMGATYEANRNICRYVHSTSRGHEAIQLAAGLQLKTCDYVSPYYRDDAMLLGMGFTATELMMQLLAKAGDPFSGGRSYYAHPSNRGNNKPTIIHQSSATGMQVIPATGIAQGLKHIENYLPAKIVKSQDGELPVVICSLGDASVTEGEVSEAFQFASLKQLPIIFLVQDNEWGISVSANEARVSDAFDFTSGLTGLNRVRVNGSDFVECYECIQHVIAEVRTNRVPYLVHAKVPLLGHHTSGVRKEFYRSSADLAKHAEQDPLPILKNRLSGQGISDEELFEIEKEISLQITEQFKRVVASPEPDPATVFDHVFAPAAITTETGERSPADGEKVMMVDAALHAIRELMEKHEELILFGQDVGRRLGGVFREAATLAERFGDHRVFNTAIQEAYI
ncbi:MAG: tungsten formylmethanofuran dehydrogenase, partial [Chitinophagaceae bacterium]